MQIEELERQSALEAKKRAEEIAMLETQNKAIAERQRLEQEQENAAKKRAELIAEKKRQLKEEQER